MPSSPYKHRRTCAICGQAKGFTRRVGDLTVCGKRECVEEARARTAKDDQAGK